MATERTPPTAAPITDCPAASATRDPLLASSHVGTAAIANAATQPRTTGRRPCTSDTVRSRRRPRQRPESDHGRQQRSLQASGRRGDQVVREEDEPGVERERAGGSERETGTQRPVAAPPIGHAQRVEGRRASDCTKSGSVGHPSPHVNADQSEWQRGEEGDPPPARPVICCGGQEDEAADAEAQGRRPGRGSRCATTRQGPVGDSTPCSAMKTAARPSSPPAASPGSPAGPRRARRQSRRSRACPGSTPIAAVAKLMTRSTEAKHPLPSVHVAASSGEHGAQGSRQERGGVHGERGEQQIGTLLRRGRRPAPARPREPRRSRSRTTRRRSRRTPPGAPGARSGRAGERAVAGVDRAGHHGRRLPCPTSIPPRTSRRPQTLTSARAVTC